MHNLILFSRRLYAHSYTIIDMAGNSWLFLVYDHRFSPLIVQVAKRCERGIFTSSDFLAESSFCILGKRIHIVFALSKGDIEHELSLRGTLKPERREFESTYTPSIEEIDDLAAVHTISG